MLTGPAARDSRGSRRSSSYPTPCEAVATKPVLYLDLDDTLVSWRGGHPHAAPGAGHFVRWALRHFEVRWLTTWCPNGEMGESLLGDLAHMLGIPVDELRHIRGGDWDATESKLNGVMWLEHVVLERPFLWVEDNYGVGTRELAFLEAHGFLNSYHQINVTEDPEALQRLHARLRDDPALFPSF